MNDGLKQNDRHQMDKRIDSPEAFRRVFSVSRETIEKLEIFAALLKKWQRAHNLVAANTLDQIWHRHFSDSAQLAALAPEARNWLDLGSGAGFPGLVLAILNEGEGGKTFHLVESNGRKCAFLETVSRETATPVEIHCERIEKIGDLSLEFPDAITARALAPLDRLLNLVKPYMGPQTRLILPKGRDVDNEMKAVVNTWKFDFEKIASLTDADGRILIISKLHKLSDTQP